MTGRRFGRIVVVCSPFSERAGESTRCAMIGQTFSRLTITARAEKKPYHGHAYYVCRCSCGKATEKVVREDHLLSGSTKSCGCLRRETWSAFRMWQRAGGPA
jgi:hypothetical protein